MYTATFEKIVFTRSRNRGNFHKCGYYLEMSFFAHFQPTLTNFLNLPFIFSKNFDDFLKRLRFFVRFQREFCLPYRPSLAACAHAFLLYIWIMFSFLKFYDSALLNLRNCFVRISNSFLDTFQMRIRMRLHVVYCYAVFNHSYSYSQHTCTHTHTFTKRFLKFLYWNGLVALPFFIFFVDCYCLWIFVVDVVCHCCHFSSGLVIGICFG